MPTPPPEVTADREPWYRQGLPIAWAGKVYYPAGALVHFDREEMVRSGSFQGIPLYVRTTIEVGSVVFVPLEGGLMQPYERRRAGELAGTTGSRAPSFPVILPAEQDDDLARAGVSDEQAPTPRPGQMTVGMVGRVAGEAAMPPEREYPFTAEPAEPADAAAYRYRSALRSAALPEGLNGVYVTYEGRRWFSDGPTVEYDAARHERAGAYEGYPVYRVSGRRDVIYVQIFEGDPGLLSVYRAR